MGDRLESFEYHFEQQIETRHLQRFHHFSERMHQLVSQQDGFISLERKLIEQRDDVCFFRTSLRFSTIQQCMNWLDDPRRRRLLHQEEEDTGFRFQGRANWIGYGRWLTRRIKRRVPTWKVNLLVLLTLYPSAMVLKPLLMQLLPGASAASIMLVSNSLCIAATAWLLVPAASRIYRPWLEGETTRWQAIGALLSVLVLLLVLWWLFGLLPLTGGH